MPNFAFPKSARAPLCGARKGRLYPLVLKKSKPGINQRLLKSERELIAPP